MRSAVSVVASVLKGNASNAELQKLAVQYWGCVLFEMRRNLIQTASVVSRGKLQGTTTMPSLAFPFYDALIGDIARVAPTPLLTSIAGRVNAELQTIQRLVSSQIAGGAIPYQLQPGVPTSTLLDIGTAWRGAAASLIDRHIKDYNVLVGAVGVDGEHAYKTEWPTVHRTTLPPALPVDLSEAAKATSHGL